MNIRCYNFYMKDVNSEAMIHFLATWSIEVQELVKACRSLILEVRPDAIEQIDPADHLIGYGFDQTYKGLVCAITVFRSYTNLMLARGAALPDPDQLLLGTGKHARHIRIRQSGDLAAAGVRRLLENAWETHPRV